MRTVFWVGFWTFLADQASKYLVFHWMDLQTRQYIEIWPPYLNFSEAWNYGINFGLFSNQTEITRWALIVVSLVISAAVAWWIRYDDASPIARVSAGLLIGGALGNVVDRFIYGAVADFLNMSCCGWNNPFSFNLADVAVFVGAFGMVVFTSPKKAA